MNDTEPTEEQQDAIKRKYLTATNALASFIGSKEREQVILTPPEILDAVDVCFPDGWVDVYPCPGSPATERGFCSVLQGAIWDAHGRAPWGGLGPAAYANPPYKDLNTAMASAARQDTPVVMLAPVRCRRLWWHEHLDGAEVAFLKPVTFIKPKDRPADKNWGSMAENMGMYGWRVDRARFYLAFRHLAHHITTWRYQSA